MLFGQFVASQHHKRTKFNPVLKSYFKTGLFGSVIVPRSLLHLELLRIELRWHYDQNVESFRNDQYMEYLIQCEGKILELLQLCHPAVRLQTTTFPIKFQERKFKYFGMTLGRVGAHKNGCVLLTRALNTYLGSNNSGGLLRGVRDVPPGARLVDINGTECREWKYESILEALNGATLPTTVTFECVQNTFPLLKENRNAIRSQFYTVHHLAQILKDRCILELVVLLCKIWYECESTVDDEEKEKEEKEVDEDEMESMKRTQLEVMVSILDEAGLHENPNLLELDHFLMAEVHLLMANIYFNCNDFEKCYAELVRVLDLQPNNINAMRHFYTLYRALAYNTKLERTVKRQLLRKQEAAKANKGRLFVWHEMILGHSSFSKSSYSIAAHAYARILKQHHESPFMHLMMGITYLHHCLNKSVGVKGKKYIIAIQAIAFIKCYVKLSGTSACSLYNFARALHFLGLYAPAEALYRKIIQRIRTGGHSRSGLDDAVLRYSAFNLSKLYISSGPGQVEIAFRTLQRHIVV